jgi:protein-S-isoprenylcysteine O-methyltransferase Ste14
MSTTEEDERKEYVKRASDTQTGQENASQSSQVPVTSSPVERKEVVQHRRSTNTGAMVAIAIGIAVLVVGIILIYSQIRFLPWPYSIIVTLAFGLILLAIGASFISSRTHTTAA